MCKLESCTGLNIVVVPIPDHPHNWDGVTVVHPIPITATVFLLLSISASFHPIPVNKQFILVNAVL